MQIYISWNADNLGRALNLARLGDDVAEIRRASNAVEQGNELWKSFALRVGGSTVELDGDGGCIEVPIDKMMEVSPIAEQYLTAVGTTVSVGLGMKVSESAKALLVAKLRGGDQILLWQADMETEVQKALAPKTEASKAVDDFLGKEESHHKHHQVGVGGNRGVHAGFDGHKQPKMGATEKAPHQADHEEGAVLRHMLQDAKPPKMESVSPIEAPPAELSPEEELHQHAEKQEQADRDEAISKDATGDQLKQELVQVLTTVKQQMPVLTQLKTSAPDVFNTIMNLVNGVIALGRQTLPPDPVAKSEDLEKAISQIPKPEESDESTPNVDESMIKGISDIEGTPTQPNMVVHDPGRAPKSAMDYTHILPEHERSAGMNLQVLTHHDGALQARLHHTGSKIPVGTVDGFIGTHEIEPHSNLHPKYQGRGLGSAMYEALYVHAKNERGVTHVEGGIHSEAAHKMHQRLAAKHGFEYSPGTSNMTSYPHGPYSYVLKSQEDGLDESAYIGPGKGVIFAIRPKAMAKSGSQQIRATSKVQPGSSYPVAEKTHDYSHVLPERQQTSGLKLHVKHSSIEGLPDKDNHTLYATLKNGSKLVGSVKGYVRPQGNNEYALEPHSFLNEDYRGKGLGQAMYEALYSHAKNHLGISKVAGDMHSGDADKLHRSLAKKHGFDYVSERKINPDRDPAGEFPYAPYEYAIKDEMAPTHSEDHFIGEGKGPIFLRDQIMKTSAAIPGTPSNVHLNMPNGSVVNGRIKVQHGDGGQSWVEAKSGAVAAQDPGSPTLGANSHPTSSKMPNAR